MHNFQTLLTSVLWISVVKLAAVLPAAGASRPPPRSNCSKACGDVKISYPFGFEAGCSLPGFELICRDTSNGKKPFMPPVPESDGYLELESVSLLDGKARVWNNISSYCYDIAFKKVTYEFSDEAVYLPEAYRLSDTENKFIIVGCRTVAYIGVGDSWEDVQYFSGCSALCGPNGDNLTSLTDGACSGAGCCEVTISKGNTFYTMQFDSDYNTTQIYNVSRCGYAVLMESSRFTFRTSYVNSSDFINTNGGKKVPMVVEWAVRNASNCVEAQKDRDSYACISSNSVCVNSSSGPGYICNCTRGYRGNPYLLDGCLDIDECEEHENYPCYGNCKNILGNFECSCPTGTRGNASIEGACQKSFLTPGVLVTAIGVVTCVFAGLFGLLGWEVIRHRRNTKKNALLRQIDGFFQQHGGQLLLEMMKVEGNVGFTLYERGQIETATNNFNKAHIVGEGGQGTVYRAEIEGTIVAIKKCKEIDESRKMEFVQELVILCRVNHSNIVKLLGCCLQFEAPMLVYEFVQNRTLHELLDFQRSKSCHVTLGTRLRIAAESADALAHLHSLPHPILHGDVKPANILLTEELVAKVSDFGCSTINEKTQTMPKGTPGYLDPDFLLEYQLTAKNDVYSFGVILVELLTGKRPLSKERKTLTSMFNQAMEDDTLIELLDSDIVNKANMRVIHHAAVLASQCLTIPGTARPEMRHVAEELHQLALADEVQQCPQPPLVLAGLRFTAEMINTRATSSWQTDSKTSRVYSLEKKAMLSTELAR